MVVCSHCGHDESFHKVMSHEKYSGRPKIICLECDCDNESWLENQ